jgi:hypothetical protein
MSDLPISNKKIEVYSVASVFEAAVLRKCETNRAASFYRAELLQRVS